jgi:hypothetical protein
MTETASSIGQRYSLTDFNAILFKNCYGYVLPAAYFTLIAELESQLEVFPEAPVAVAPVVNSRNRGGHGHSRPRKREEDWEAVRSFKATKIEMKVGIEKTVNDVRIALNKMSTSNYEKQKDAVLELVGGYFGSEDECTPADTERISKAIFDIASTNKFYSEIYAKLYVELAQLHAVFRDLLSGFVENFSKNTGALTYVDPDVDYDGYCLYTKSCDNRKATTTFIVNCLKRGLVSPDKVCTIIRENLGCIDTWMLEDGKTKEVEEIVENLFIVLTLAKDDLKTVSEWTPVTDKVKVLAKTKGKSQVSWSNRAAFKMMDLVELV